MELPLESIDAPLTNFRPRTGTMEAWNAAYVRVEDYLRAHRIHNRLHQSRLIHTVLESAARRHAVNPALDPTTLAAEECGLMMANWFRELLGEMEVPDNRITTAGRVALLISDGPEKWPYAFLQRENLPADFIKIIKASSMEAGPDMAVSSMVPRQIDLGTITEAAGDTIEQIENLPILGTLLLWAMFMAALTGIFYMTR